MHSADEKIAQIAGNNSLTIARNVYENVFDDDLCKETVMELTIVEKIARFPAL